MTMDKSIFGLRFGSNVTIQPTHEELRMFLESKKKEGERELHGSVLTTYNKWLERVLSFQRGQLPEAPTRHEHNKMFYGVLNHSSFFNPGLETAVEQYKYQLHALSTIDFRRLRASIKAAEEEISLLGSGKKADTARKVKMQDWVDERKKSLETLSSRRPVLIEELGHIARYISDNLFKIANRCETAIVILVDSSIARKKENQLIEDIKIYFEERLKYDLHDGLSAGQRLENAKNDFALLSTELSENFRENIFALTQLYESIYDHVLKTAREIDTLMGENRRIKNRSFPDEVGLFTRIEKVLDSLVSGKRFEFKATEGISKTKHTDVFLEKREEMFDYLFELMQKDRRSRFRRYREKRRSSYDTQYQVPGRRSGTDRRSGKDRRKH